MPIRPLSPELQVKAEEELNEVPSRIQDDLKHIREWLAEQPHLNARSDDQWLLSFLRGCKFDLERTKQKLDLFYTMRTLVPEFFSNRDPLSPITQELLTFGSCIPLPKTSDPASVTTILIRHKPVYCEKVHIMDVLKIIPMILDILIIEDDNFAVAGLTAIVDIKGISLTHLLQVTPGNSKKMMTCFQNAYPVRPKQVYFLNTSAPFEALFKIVRLFMTEKLKSRINIYSQQHIDELLHAVPADILPTEYGGTAGSLEDMAMEWKTKVESYRDWYLEDAKYCSDETKRPEKPSAGVFGICRRFISRLTSKLRE